MTSVVRASEAAVLDPIRAALDGVRLRLGEAPVHGVTPALVVADPAGWLPATGFADGSAVDELLAAGQIRWPGDPHVAAALAWKSYAYWTVLPAVIGFASGRRVPAVNADNMLVRMHGIAPFVEVGLVRPDVVMRADDPLAVGGSGIVVADDAALLAAMRTMLLDRHLDPLLDQVRRRVRIGRRTLRGSIASAVCYALLRATDVLPGPAEQTAAAILDALGVADLVDFGADATGRLQVRRRTCCLAFALDEPKICASCVIPTAR